jgi:hypothetical protein
LAKSLLDWLEIVHGFDGLARRAHKTFVVHPSGQNFGARKFFGGVLVVVVPRGCRRDLGGVGHKGQFKRFHDGKTPCGVARQGDGEVVNAVFHTIDQLRRCAATRHGGQNLTLHAASRFSRDFVAPGLHHAGVAHGHSGPNMVKLECDLLRVRGATQAEHAQRERSAAY